MFSSKSSEWSTPQSFYDKLNNMFKFTLDVCASELNHKCEKYFDINKNGLEQKWNEDICFMNPPYGRGINKWIEKAYKESLEGATVVCLIPARVDSRWAQDYCLTKAKEVYFVRGRLKFGDDTNGVINSAPFPSMVCVFQKHDGDTKFYCMDR